MKKLSALFIAWLLVLSSLLFIPSVSSPVYATSPVVQECEAEGNNVTTASCAFPSKVTSGNIVYCGVFAASTSNSSVISDSQGTLFTPRNDVHATTGGTNYIDFQTTGTLTAGGTDAVTLDVAGATALVMMDCLEIQSFYEVIDSRDTASGSATSGGTYSLALSPALIPTSGDLLLVYATSDPCLGTNTITYDAAYTADSANTIGALDTGVKCHTVTNEHFVFSQAGMTGIASGSTSATMTWTFNKSINTGTGAWALLVIALSSTPPPPPVTTVTVTSGTINGNIGSAVMDQMLSYGNINSPQYTVAAQNAELQMLYSSNAKCIRVDLGYAAWLNGNTTQQQEAETLVQGIKSSGHCLILADAASETYRHKGAIPWAQFETVWVSRVSTFAALFQPNYYIVIKEPPWYCPMISDCQTNAQVQNLTNWIALTKNLTNAVVAASPSTQVGIAISGTSLYKDYASYSAFMNGEAAIPNLSILGFDIYTANSQSYSETYIGQYGTNGKAVWIAEWWPTTDGTQGPNDPQSLENEYVFGTQVGASFIIPFFTYDFANYTLSAQTSTPTIISMLQNDRTPIFYAYMSTISSLNIGSTTTETTTTTGGGGGGGSGPYGGPPTSQGGQSTQATSATVAELLAAGIVAVLVYTGINSRRGPKKRFEREVGRTPKRPKEKRRPWWWA